MPAVATQSWCDTAAETLLPLAPSGLIYLAIGDLDDNARRVRIRAAGLASQSNHFALPQLRAKTAAKLDIQWTLGNPADWAGHGVSRLISIDRLRVGHAAGVFGYWSELCFEDVAAGARCLQRSSRRIIIAEIGSSTDQPPFTQADASLLSAVLSPLADRARLAFGGAPSDEVSLLTAREQEILEQLALGKSVREIAETLRRSPHTVHDHVKSLHRKLNASTRGELVARALGHIGPHAHQHDILRVVDSSALDAHALASA